MARASISKSRIDAVLFDLDGVVTKTAAVHAAAWKRLFDEYLGRRADREHSTFRPFDLDVDYRQYVDGKPRYDGVRSFLRSRSIVLDKGTPGDPPDRETVCGLGNRKDRYFQDYLATHGAEAYESAVALIAELRSSGIKTAVVSASKHCEEVVRAAGVTALFDTRVDGTDAETLRLAGKPSPATYQEAARRLGVAPARAAVIEDAIAGVEAGRAGGFGLVIGVNRTASPGVLLDHGADVEVHDLDELQVCPDGRR